MNYFVSLNTAIEVTGSDGLYVVGIPEILDMQSIYNVRILMHDNSSFLYAGLFLVRLLKQDKVQRSSKAIDSVGF